MDLAEMCIRDRVIAGPCSVEGENLIRIARRVKAAGATMLRGGAYKPRTSPYAYQGMGCLLYTSSWWRAWTALRPMAIWWARPSPWAL